ncbi:MAG: winged helix-turn-helix transcriptional regulator [Solirubrobacterales bacterium]|nr:winged helix-turn-helix transcriptional regulator [Solirubrobacterales bacterium]
MDDETCDLLCLDLPKAEALRAALPEPQELRAAAELAKAAGDPTRLAVLLALRGEQCCVCDLAWVIGRPEKLVSHHLRLLKAAGAVRSRREGRMVVYELTATGAALVAAVEQTREALR